MDHRHQPKRISLLKGTLIAAIGFEILKSVMTWLLPRLASSPSGAFGSVIGLMAFFTFARLTLFCAADCNKMDSICAKKTRVKRNLS